MDVRHTRRSEKLRLLLDEGDLVRGRAGPGYAPLVGVLAARTRELFDRARPLLQAVGGRLGIELRLVWLGGRRILDRVEEAGPVVFTARPALSTAEKAGLAARALLGTAG